jgi:hypothetical protein
MEAKPGNGRSWMKLPLLCVEAFSVKCGLQKMEPGQHQNIVDLSLSVLGNSKHTACPSYNAPWFGLSTSLCGTWVWNSPSRTVLSSSHCGAAVVKNSGSHPEHTMSWFDNSRHGRQEWGYIESQSPVDLTSLVLYPSGDTDQGNTCWTKLPWVNCVSWCSYLYGFWHKAIFLSKKSSQ